MVGYVSFGKIMLYCGMSRS